MNKQWTLYITMFMMLIYSSALYGQKIMKLDDELKTSSTPMEAKRKGISTVGKYAFGPYKIVSGKAGWTTTNSKGAYWGDEYGDIILKLNAHSESRKKSSFVFVANEKDTVQVNTSTITKASETFIGRLSWLNQSDENYVAIISPSADTAGWILILNTQSGEKVEGNFSAQGVLTDGVTEIQIREVKQWEDGKDAFWGVICGYEFYRDDYSIAAVQSSLDTFQKKFVWLHQDLDDPMKTLLAAASAALMVHTDEAQAEQ